MAGKSAEDTPTDWQFTEVSTQTSDSGVVRSEEALPAGTLLGEYLVGNVIGRGGGGIVYAATHRLLGRRAAIKVLRAEMAAHPKMVTRFLREAVAVNKIGHPNIIDIFEFGELEPGRPYYVMELLDGVDLRRMLALHGRYSAAECFELLAPIFDAVSATHRAGMLHRDLKANNIVIVEGPAGRTVKLLDFGIAKMLHGEGASQGLTEPGAVIGTAHNMAPEQVRGERPDERADIYALGVLLFQLLTGQYPFDGPDARHVALMHLQVAPPRPCSLAPIPHAVEAVILRCLEKSPERRFASVAELTEAYRAALSERPVHAGATPRTALAAFFELLTDVDELDDALVEELGNMFELLERELAERAFQLPLRTANSLLAVRLLGAPDDREGEQAAVDALRTLRALLDGRGADARLHVSIALQVGPVLCQAGAAGPEVVGGPLLKTGSWRDPHRL
jgi:serine/threonine-protein kinase